MLILPIGSSMNLKLTTDIYIRRAIYPFNNFSIPKNLNFL